MGKPDALSRREDHAVGIQDDNKMVLIIPPEQIASTTLQIVTDADDIRNRIRDATVRIRESDVITLYKKHGICKDQDGILFTRSGKMYIPEDRDLRMEIVRLHHDTPIPGHPGMEKTLELMQRSYTWPGMPALVKDYISRYDCCTRFKGSNQAPPGKLKLLNTPPGPWKEISVDFIMDLPESEGFDSILVVVDRFSKEVEFIPCTKSVSALDTAKLYLRHVWKHHGLPTGIVLDRGPQFASQVMKDICKRLGIQPRLSTAYHPQTDRQTERINRDLQQYLRIFTSEKQNEWVSWLPLAQFSYNTKKQLSTEKSPFEVTRSYQPKMGFEQRTTKAQAAEELTKQMEETLEQTKENIEKAKARMKHQADRHRSQAPDYEIGNKVWLSTENLKLTRTSKKLTERWLGPYDITKRIGDNAIELRLPRLMKIHPVVNISRVKLYKERLEGQPTFKPGPVQVTENKEIEFEVEAIMDSRWKEHCLEYLVHWKGYSEEDHTWESKGNLTNTSEAIKDFHRLKPNTPRSLNMSQADFYSLFAYCGKPIPEINQICLPFDRLNVD